MKKRILLLILCISMLASLIACGSESYDLLYSVNHEDGKTYCVRGSGTQAKQLVVKSGEEVLWSVKVDVSDEVGNQGGTFGFAADDLNFDGYRDLTIYTDVSGDCYTSKCYLYNPSSGKYDYSSVLSQLNNVKGDANLKAVFGFEHTYKSEPAYLDVPACYISTDAATKYVWKDGALTPEIRVSITYYSETARYLYSVAYYNSTSKKFEEDFGKEIWFTAEEYKNTDTSVVYYFK